MRPLMFKLHQNPESRGLRCDREGLFLGGEPLLERDDKDRFQPRPPTEIRTILRAAYRAETDWASRIRSAEIVATALNKGDIARAMMAAVLMRLPEPDGTIHIVGVDGALAKAGFDPDEPRDEGGRWTTGAGTDEAPLIPAQLTIAEPLIEPLLGEIIRPFPGTIDIVPPAAVPDTQQLPRAKNPYPGKRECAEEWAYAEQYCRDLLRRGKFGKDGSRGFGKNYEKCLLGMVSEECGGNPTA